MQITPETISVKSSNTYPFRHIDGASFISYIFLYILFKRDDEHITIQQHLIRAASGRFENCDNQLPTRINHSCRRWVGY